MNRWILLAALCAGCIGDGKDGDTHLGGDSSSAGSDSDPMGGGDCGESGICSLSVSDASGECGNGSIPAGLTVSSAGPGALSITQGGVSEGCCPSIDVSGEASLRSNEITVNWNLYDDLCDCICMLDVAYTLSDIPSGSYTLFAPGESPTMVTVE